MKLYELPRDKGIKLFINSQVTWGYDGNKLIVENPTIIFGHIDGMYSYCWLEDHEDRVIHLNASTELEQVKGGYKVLL